MASTITALAHQASALVEVSPDEALAFMADPEALGHWALGSMATRPDGPDGVWTGASVFDGGRSWMHLETDAERRIVYYHIGTVEHRRPRIMARIMPHGAHAIITLLAWREPDMDDARWQRLEKSHELEILIIQAQCPQWVARRRQP